MATSEDVASDRREQWLSVPVDPDLERDLGYELLEFEAIEAPTNDQTVFLPADEERLKDEAFIIASNCFVCDPIEHR